MTMKEARETIAQGFKDDPDLRTVWVAHVACLLMDTVPGFKRNKSKRDVIASLIIRRLFES
jgi:hypothetical protein